MRRLPLILLAAAAVCLAASPAHAAEDGQIDHLESAPDGRVTMLYSVPELPSGTAVDLDSVKVQVQGKVVRATAEPVDAGEVRRAAVLALDVSNSMAGERFAAAKDAASAYLEAAPDDVAIGLVTFAGSVEVVREPTTDHAQLLEDVNALDLAPGTLLYDGVLEALGQTGSEGQRQVVVLSDGADTGSTELADVVSSARESGVTVNVVALEQSAANQAKLRQITDATEGAVLPADDPAALAEVFAAEAEALAQQVLIQFDAPSSGEVTVTASLEAGGVVHSDSTFASLSGDSSKPATPRGPVPVDPPSFVLDDRFLVAGAAALGLGLAVILGLVLLGKPEDRQAAVQRQLNFYSRGSHRQEQPAHKPASVRPQVNVRESAVAVAGRLVQGADLETRITKRLTAAAVSLTAAEWLLLHAGVAVAAALVGFLIGGGNLLVFLVGLLLGLVAPWLFLSVKKSRRVKAFNGQLADTLQLMSGGLSAGLSLPQAVDTVVREGSEPMVGELRRALIEQRLGVDIEDALDGVAERMQSKDFAWVVMAVRIQREIGGNLAELLNTVAATLREREYLRRQVQTLSAEGRLSAVILGGLPPGFALYLAVVRPEYLEPLYSTTMGWLISAGSAVMMTIGIIWLRATVKVEV